MFSMAATNMIISDGPKAPILAVIVSQALKGLQSKHISQVTFISLYVDFRRYLQFLNDF